MTPFGAHPNSPSSSPAMDGVKSIGASLADVSHPREQRLEDLIAGLEVRFVEATWTLRRLPDRDKGLLSMRTMIWPDAHAAPGDYAPTTQTSLQVRLRSRIDPKEIDRMQPTLDLLILLPDPLDRQLLFWSAWHQDGERQIKLPWAKVRRSMGCSLSRWTLKRRYENSLKWLASIILAQV